MHRMSSVDEFQREDFFDHIALTGAWREQERIVHLTDHGPEKRRFVEFRNSNVYPDLSCSIAVVQSRGVFMRMKLVALAAALAILGVAAPAILRSAEKSKQEKMVKDGSVVSLQYSLSEEDGKLIESNKGKDPLKYTHGG